MGLTPWPTVGQGRGEAKVGESAFATAHKTPDSHAKARSYSSIQRSIASSTNTKSTSVNVRAIWRNFGRNPFNAVNIRRRDSGEMLAPNVEAGVEATMRTVTFDKLDLLETSGVKRKLRTD